MTEENNNTAVIEKELYSWSTFDDDCFFLSVQIELLKKQGLVDSIFGVPRGGLVVAVKLSHLTNLPMVFRIGDINTRTIVVDDILDSGMTLNRISERASRMRHIVVLHKNEAITLPPNLLSFNFAKRKLKWIVYPWETFNSSKYDGTL